MEVMLVGPPAVAPNADGRLELFAGDEMLYHIWQTSPGGRWSNWGSLGHPSSSYLDGGKLAVAPNADGRLELFVELFAGDGMLYHIWQTSPGGSWSNWDSLGNPPSGTLGAIPPVLAPGADGRLELFVSGDDGNLYHICQTSPGGSWSNWDSLGQPSSTSIDRMQALAPGADGRFELFASGDDGNLYHIWQTSPDGSWSNWLSHGRPPSTYGVDTPVLARNADGRLELFVIGLGKDMSSGPLYHIWQTSPNGSWSNWDSLGHPSSSYLRGDELAVVPNADGRLELFALADKLYHIWQTSPGGSWSNWDSIGGSSPIPPEFSRLRLATNADGRFELFSMRGEGVKPPPYPVYHIWQTSPGGRWSTWDSLGLPTNS